MTFTTLNLANDRVLVRGTDSQGTNGEQVLDGSQWFSIRQDKEFSRAEKDFASAVEDFFAPLTDAVDELRSKMERPTDPITHVVFEEAEEAKAGKPGKLIKLSHDSIVLRLIEEGQPDRLVWVDGELEVLAAGVTPPQATVPGTTSSDVAAAQAEVSEQESRVRDEGDYGR